MCKKASVPEVQRALEDEKGEQAELGQKPCRGGHRLPLCSALGIHHVSTIHCAKLPNFLLHWSCHFVRLTHLDSGRQVCKCTSTLLALFAVVSTSKLKVFGHFWAEEMSTSAATFIHLSSMVLYIVKTSDST